MGLGAYALPFFGATAAALMAILILPFGFFRISHGRKVVIAAVLVALPAFVWALWGFGAMEKRSAVRWSILFAGAVIAILVQWLNETIERLQDGAIGNIQYMRAFWNSGGVWTRPRTADQTEMEYQMRNWYYFVWLCGDNICEQHVHNLDIGNWVMGDHPVEANGMGGCTARYLGELKGTGQIFDHFVKHLILSATDVSVPIDIRHLLGS